MMLRFLGVQFFVSLILCSPVWPASYVYKNGIIIALDPTSTLVSGNGNYFEKVVISQILNARFSDSKNLGYHYLFVVSYL